MKRFISYIIIVVTCLLISSCSIDWNNEKDDLLKERNNKIDILNSENITLKNDIKEINDKNKKECLWHYNSIKNEILDSNKIYWEQYDLIEVFYSKKLNECIYIVYTDSPFNIFVKKAYKYWVNVTNWKPFLAYEIRYSTCESEDCIQAKKEETQFNDKIKELKE